MDGISARPLTMDPDGQDRVERKSTRGAGGESGIRIGVVGCGYWGSKHVRVLSGLRDVRELALIDPEPRCRGAIASAFPAARVFADLESALPHVDALVVATPPQTHAALALEALRHGKHVLVEKPLATTLAEAHAVVSEAHRSNAILMAGHTFQFNPVVRDLQTRVHRGELGEIYYMVSNRLNLGLYRSDVNVVWDLAPHDISIFNYILRSHPTTVTAWGSSRSSFGAEDVVFVRLEYKEVNVTGYIHISWLDPKKVRRVTMVGSRKMAVYDDMAEEPLRIFDRGVDRPEDELAPYERPLSYRYGDIISPHIPFQEPLALEDQHFVDCIRNGASPETDGVSGLTVVTVLEAIDRSLRTQRSVEIEWGPTGRTNGARSAHLVGVAS